MGDIKSIADIVRAAAAAQLCIKPQEVDMGKRLMDHDCDSLDHVELMMQLEDDVGLTIPDADAERLRQHPLQETVQYLEARRTAAAA